MLQKLFVLLDVKTAYPQLHCIGQDLHPGMVEYAKTHSNIDEIYAGDAINSPLPDESVDYVFFRFLNCAVVTSELANTLFSKLANKCKNGGYLIVFGHSPVLLSAEWFEFLGLEVLQNTGYCEQTNSIFQYYVLKKTAPVPTLSYEQFSVYNYATTWSDSTNEIAPPRLSAKL